MTENKVVRGRAGIAANGKMAHAEERARTPESSSLRQVASSLFPLWRRCVPHFSFLVPLLFFSLTTLHSPLPLSAQTETATISGLVTDEGGAVMPGAEVKLQSVERGTAQTTSTNNAGLYLFANIQPGQYQIRVHKPGFKQVDFLGLIVNVQDRIEQNFRLQVGSVSESTTVRANGLNINTTDAAVSTLIDQQFVANIPLNGRSLQSLISLSPGVLLTPTYQGAGIGVAGEMSVNGQRTEANYFTVDGVSANTGSSPISTFNSGMAGTVPGETVLGTTQSIISLDSLQEFRATTSTYSAEYGRTPGGQFSFVSRAGTNDWHGSAFDYFRNDALDASNWFNSFTGLFRIPKTQERQNDFGGTLGGPLRIPGLYNGKDKTFFFFSYEGLRLREPEPAVLGEYPDVTLRQNAPSALRPFLNAFPVPNGPEVLGNRGVPIGLAFFTAAYSVPSSLDAISIRIDHYITQSMKIFGRYNESPSSTTARDGSDLALRNISSIRTHAVTLGTTNIVSPRMNNELRFNYTSNTNTLDQTLDTFGGAKPITLAQVPGFESAPRFAQFGFELEFFGETGFGIGVQQDAQQQWNITDAFVVNRGSHNLKFGIDYRRLSTFARNRQIAETVSFFSQSQVLQNISDLTQVFSDAPTPPRPIYSNSSLYAQDEWKATRKLSVSLGLRWDVNPPPGNANGVPPYTLNQIANLSTAELAPAGTPLWHTDYHAFAPRLGAAYLIRQSQATESVIRAGFGMFYDMGNVLSSAGFGTLGFFDSGVMYSNVSFPLTNAQLVLPPPSVAPPYTQSIYAFDPQLTLPYTMQWNVALEQGLGHDQSMTLSYVGSAGRRLLFTSALFPRYPNFSLNRGLYLTTGKANSNYNSLQATFQKKLSHGLQALASYTWSHSIDDGSSNFFIDELVRGSSDFDVRQNFQMALTYDIPGSYSHRLGSAVLMHWGFDARVSARTALPIDVQDGSTVLPNGQIVNLRPDLVSGVPIYLYGSQYPGGRILNDAAFKPDPGGQGNLPRNFARDFGWWQADLALRRDFPINERLRVQFRAEAFNVLNHPNFTNIASIGFASTYAGPYPAQLGEFGGAQSTPNNSLGGLSPLYQIGGPRSLQLMLRLIL